MIKILETGLSREELEENSQIEKILKKGCIGKMRIECEEIWDM